MCSVSMIGDHYNDMFRQKAWYPSANPEPPGMPASFVQPGPSRAEFDELKRQVLEMKELLKRAKEYDERNGEPECETDEKMAVLRKVAEVVGVKLDDVLGSKPA